MMERSEARDDWNGKGRLPKQWSAVRAALYGALIGAAYSSFRAWNDEAMSHWLGMILGGTLGSSFVFTSVCVFRNFFARDEIPR
jgi:hypothetical protein